MTLHLDCAYPRVKTTAASTLTVMRLTRIERNQIFEAIAADNLDPAEYDLRERGDRVTITHTNSGSTFRFASGSRGAIDIYRVQSDVVDGHHLQYVASRRIDSLINRIVVWADEAKATFEAPDLWAEMQRSREFIVEIQQTDSGNAPFTQDEQRQIAAQLPEITKQLKEEFELTNEQVARIEELRDEVVEASTRMGRKDWVIWLLGTITALTIAATVPAGVGEHIFTVVIHALGYLFTGGSEPPRILA